MVVTTLMAAVCSFDGELSRILTRNIAQGSPSAVALKLIRTLEASTRSDALAESDDVKSWMKILNNVTVLLQIIIGDGVLVCVDIVITRANVLDHLSVDLSSAHDLWKEVPDSRSAYFPLPGSDR